MVHSGLLRSYHIDDNGKEHIFMFAPEDWIIGDAIRPEQACNLYIDALEDSVISIHEKDPEVSMIDKKKMRKRVEVMQMRIIMFMSSTPMERYDHFVATYPDIVKRVPQRMIASFVGVAPETLSKLKSDRKKSDGKRIS